MDTRLELQTRVPSSPFAGMARADALQSAGINVLRYALVLVFLLFGVAKFTAAEAAAIQPLVANSPLMGWLYSILGVQGVSNAIGMTELVTAALIAVRPLSARASAIGSALAAATFVTTLSFLFSTPGALSPMHPAHAFLIKDVVLFGAAVALGGEAFRAARRAQTG